MPSWPSNLPFFKSRDGFAITGPQNNIIRSKMSVGPDKVRRRTSAGVRIMSGAMPYISEAQFATFEAFHEIELAGGALDFEAPHPITGESESFRFRSTYTARYVGPFIEVSAELEILP